MNSNSYCREPIDDTGRRCGLLHNHYGPHHCCTLHRPMEQYLADERRYGN